MITTILFDFYGVFQADVYTEWLYRNNLERVGVFDDLAKQIDHGEITQPEFVSSLSDILQRPVSPEELYGEVPVIDQRVVELARHLSHTYTLGLISNAGKSLRPKLQNEGIYDIFSSVTISSEIGHAKPEHEIYKTALASLDAAPQETIYIDDNPAFIAVGNELGINSLLFTDINQLRQSLGTYDIAIDDTLAFDR